MKHSYVVTRPSGGLSEKESSFDDGVCIDGHVDTPHGIVIVYSEKSPLIRFKYTSLRMINNGRVHHQSFERYYTPRGLVTLAARFAAEVCK